MPLLTFSVLPLEMLIWQLELQLWTWTWKCRKLDRGWVSDNFKILLYFPQINSITCIVFSIGYPNDKENKYVLDNATLLLWCLWDSISSWLSRYLNNIVQYIIFAVEIQRELWEPKTVLVIPWEASI